MFISVITSQLKVGMFCYVIDHVVCYLLEFNFTWIRSLLLLYMAFLMQLICEKEAQLFCHFAF